MADQAETRNQNAARITERAAKDPAFRAELLADPKGVLARELGVALPDYLEVTVLEETPGSVYLVLPSAPLAAGPNFRRSNWRRWLEEAGRLTRSAGRVDLLQTVLAPCPRTSFSPAQIHAVGGG
jgi:hypothetical protein